MAELPDICKNCKRNGTIERVDSNSMIHKLELCKYKETIKELVIITNGDSGLKTHCSFKEEK